MSIEDGFYEFFLDTIQMYPDFKPDQTDYPVGSFKLISWSEDETHDGPSGIEEHHFQFTIHAEAHLQCINLAKSIRSKLQADPKNIGESKIGHIRVTNIFDIGFFPEWGAWQVAVDAMIYEDE